jgi:hypothetical protein
VRSECTSQSNLAGTAIAIAGVAIFTFGNQHWPEPGNTVSLAERLKRAVQL